MRIIFRVICPHSKKWDFRSVKVYKQKKELESSCKVCEKFLPEVLGGVRMVLLQIMVGRLIGKALDRLRTAPLKKKKSKNFLSLSLFFFPVVSGHQLSRAFVDVFFFLCPTSREKFQKVKKSKSRMKKECWSTHLASERGGSSLRRVD